MHKRYRSPREIIQYAMWRYFRFKLSHRDIEDLLAHRGIIVTRESIRLGCDKFGSKYAARLRKRHQGYGEPRKIVSHKLRSYGLAHRELSGAPSPETIHNSEKYANNRAELSHQPTRVSVRKFKSVKQAQRLLNTQAAVYNMFNLGRVETVVIWYQRKHIDISGCVPLRLGKMRRWFRLALRWHLEYLRS